jgi:hypothetical protein
VRWEKKGQEAGEGWPYSHLLPSLELLSAADGKLSHPYFSDVSFFYSIVEYLRTPP